MKKQFFFAAVALVALASCSSEDFVGDSPTPNPNGNGNNNAIVFTSNTKAVTRAGELVGATAAEKLGGMFVVEGTKGSEETNSPSTTVVFDNYLVGYEANSAGKREDDTNNWEYVGLHNGISGKLSNTTWGALHSGDGAAKEQSIKYWDYSTAQYDFIAWSTGAREAVTESPTSGSSVMVTRINTGETLKTTGFTLTALSANDLKECYYTDINTVLKANYGDPVTLKFKNMAAKVRVALYETVPGYSVKDVKFYSAESDNTETASTYDPTDLGTGSSTDATLFTTGSDVLPQSGTVLVYYPHIGTTHKNATPQTTDYNKASVTVSAATGGASGVTTQAFGALTTSFATKEKHEAEGDYIGRTLPTATFAGLVADDYYKAVIPNTNGVPLTLRVDYTLVATDGSGETINVYGAKAVVPATYTVWQPNYAYTYVFKISDNSNGWTSKTTEGSPEGPAGLFPITFDAVVAKFTEANAEQTTVTTVATPSITTYQQGHTKANNEYSKSQTAGVSSAVKDVYVQVMDNSGATPTLKGDLNGANKSLLFKITKNAADYVASEAEVMDALQNRTSDWNSETPVTSPVGRNGVTLTTNANIANNVTSIINGVDDQPITQIDSDGDGDLEDIVAGQVAKIDIDQLDAGTYAYVYCTTVPSTNEKVYHVAAATSENFTNYYPVTLTLDPENPEPVKGSGSKAAADKVYFVPNKDATGKVVSYTFKQTKVNDDVEGLVEKGITSKATGEYVNSPLTFYFDVYNQNDGKYAVKVIKVV